MTDRNFAFAGVAALIVGLFVPIVSLPMVGSVNLFNNGSNLVATILLLLAVISGILAFKDRLGEIVWSGSAAAIVIGVQFLNLQYRITQMRESLQTQLKDNPFAGLAQAAVGAVQVQWGWIVLAGGAGLLIYAALRARSELSQPPFAMADKLSQGIAALSAICLVGALALIFWPASRAPSGFEASAPSNDAAAPALGGSPGSQASGQQASADEQAYIRDHLKLYDVTSKYYDSLLDGRVPGVEFKIKNAGERTLSEVDVKVEFLDDAGKAIAEETYHPVLVSSYSSDNTPLRPNYIWRQENDKFYQAKSVPEEWKTGSVKATITDIEFAPNE